MERKIGIYKITNPKNKIYVGQSLNVFDRWETYKRLNCKGQTKLYNSLKKYGFENHKFEILEECPIEFLDDLEHKHKQQIIKEVGWNNTLFLMLMDGKGGKKNPSTKTKMNISSTKIHIPIKAYTITGNYIGEYNSASEIKKIFFPEKNINTGEILNVCRRKKQSTVKGYIFQFSNDNKIEDVLNSLKNNVRIKQKTITQYDLNDNFIKEFQNSYQIEKYYKEHNVRMNSTDIRACCNGKQKTAFGYKWKYNNSLLDNHIEDNIDDIKERTEEYNLVKEEFLQEKILKQNVKNKIYSFIKEYYNNKLELNYNKEIDIFVPEFNFGINVYDLKKISHENSKILKKLYTKYQKQNIKLIQIYSDEIINKWDIIKSRLKNELNITSNKIYARKCVVKEVNVKEKNQFLNNNHIQGEDKSKIKLGLYYNNELVSVMTFRYPRSGIGKTKNILPNTYELIRFCNKINTNVVGAASKLIKYFIKNYNPTNIFSFADNRWSSPLKNVYLTCGFIQTNVSNHGYFYTKDYTKRLHRSNFTKTKLKQQGYNIENTEYDIMKSIGFYRIYDCGTTRYEITL
jgi:group I intron endonuclease